MKNSSWLFGCMVGLLFYSCASTYKPIGAPYLRYPSQCQTDNPQFSASYQYNILATSGNKKYAKKETKSQINLVAIRLTNASDRTIYLSEDIDFYCGENRVNLLPPAVTQMTIKQQPLLYLLYLGLLPARLEIANGRTAENYPLGLILGPGIAGANFLVASTANKRFGEELEAYSLIDGQIEPGETMEGIIAIAKNDYSPISIKSKRY